jgi:hypothetical protein
VSPETCPKLTVGQRRAGTRLHSGGSLECWGLNIFGQLANGSTVNSSVPVPVSGITNATAVAIGDQHTCALLGGGSVHCWGSNNYGQLGIGTAAISLVPVSVSGF